MVGQPTEAIVEQEVLALCPRDPQREALEQTSQMARQEQLLVSRGLGVDNVEGQANCGQVQHALASVGD